MFIVCYTSHISIDFQLIKQMFEIEIHHQILNVLIVVFIEYQLHLCYAHHTIRINDVMSEKCLFTVRIARLINRFCFFDY